MKLIFNATFLLLLSLNSYGSQLPSEVSTFELADGKTILTTSEGLSLYTFDLDDAGVSNCHDQCLFIWPALVTEKDELDLPFGIHIRPDGSKQITLDDRPLYLFFSDSKPGDILGDGLQGIWHIIITDL